MQRFHGSISVSLTDWVFEKKIAFVGTVPHDRKGIPKELKEVSNRNEKSILCLHHEKKILYIDKKTQVRKRHCFDSNARQCKYSKVSTAETTCSCNVLHTKGRADVTDLLSTNHSTRINLRDSPWMPLLLSWIHAGPVSNSFSGIIIFNSQVLNSPKSLENRFCFFGCKVWKMQWSSN